MRARALLERARKVCNTRKVWTKSILLEEELDDKVRMNELLGKAIALFPSYDKFRLLQCNLVQRAEESGQAARLGLTTPARVLFRHALDACPKSSKLWIAASRCTKSPDKARSFLESARIAIPGNELLWLETLSNEKRAGNDTQYILAKALQECPKSGVLIYEDILADANPETRKRKATDAIQKSDDPYVLIAVAKVLELQRSFEKARRWYAKAVQKDPTFGDAWAAWYAMVLLFINIAYSYIVPFFLLFIFYIFNYYLSHFM